MLPATRQRWHFIRHWSSPELSGVTCNVSVPPPCITLAAVSNLQWIPVWFALHNYWKEETVSEQFLNGTSAHYRLFSAIMSDKDKITLTINKWKKENVKPRLYSWYKIEWTNITFGGKAGFFHKIDDTTAANAFKQFFNRTNCEIFSWISRKVVHCTRICFTVSGSQQKSHIGRSSSVSQYKCVKWQRPVWSLFMSK